MRKTQEADRELALKWALSMRKHALREGLWPEVRAHYLAYRNNGDGAYEASRCALYDWDI